MRNNAFRLYKQAKNKWIYSAKQIQNDYQINNSYKMTLLLLPYFQTTYFFITINLFFIIKYQTKLSTIGFTQNLDNARQK